MNTLQATLPANPHGRNGELHAPATPTIEQAVRHFRTDGYIVLEDVLPPDFVAELRREYLALLAEKVERFRLLPAVANGSGNRANQKTIVEFRPEGGNHDVNRWNMHLPSRRPFIDSRLIAAPLVADILDSVLGAESYLFLIASDTPFPGATDQVIHRDFPRYGITVNVPLVDFTEDNAPLEIWPGTHQRTLIADPADFSNGNVPMAGPEVERLIQTVPGRRMLIRAGSVLIRDQRLIHRGTAHHGTEPRPCLSLWLKPATGFSPRRLSIPVPHRRVANWVARCGLRIRARGRGDGSNVNTRLTNLGNRIGMFADELARSDRDYRRRIPADVWGELAPRAQYYLRYAEVEGSNAPAVRRSLIGSGLLSVLGLFGAAVLGLSGR